MLWSRHRGKEELFERIGASGRVAPAARGVTTSVVTENSANNKIDTFLERTVDYEAEVAPGAGRVRARVRVELFNNVPTLLLPST